jgi:methionyl-tRNA formyltransferase
VTRGAQQLRECVKILCCLNADVVSNVALNLLLPSLTAHTVCIGLSTRIGSAQPSEPQARRELRAAEQLLAMEVVFPLIERAGYPDDGRYLTFREVERHRGIDVVPLPNPNAGAGLDFVRGFAPDLIVSIRYGAIFRNAVISVPPLGVLNLHAGILPDYRGVMASFRALMAGERDLGCTLHFITDGTIDRGPVVGRVRVPADPTRSLFGNVLSLYPPSIPVVANAIERLSRGEKLESSLQSGGTYYSYPSADEWEQFARRGWRVADAEDMRAVFSRYLPSEA